MSEFFVVTNSFAAPFCSDTDKRFVEAETAEAALESRRQTYSHPAGLFAARVYRDANAFEKGEPALAAWDSPEAMAQAKRASR